MLGVRLDPETEKALAAHAARVGRTKSAIVREWVREALARREHEALKAKAAAEWRAICAQEDPEMEEILEFAAQEAEAILQDLEDLDAKG